MIEPMDSAPAERPGVSLTFMAAVEPILRRMYGPVYVDQEELNLWIRHLGTVEQSYRRCAEKYGRPDAEGPDAGERQA